MIEAHLHYKMESQTMELIIMRRKEECSLR